VVVDGTFGHGGHVRALLEEWRMKNEGQEWIIVGIDLDEKMLEKGEKRIKDLADSVNTSTGSVWCLELVHGSYADLEEILKKLDIDKVDAILVDLWVNMEHFRDHDRGFSIKWEWVLDMRFDTSKWQSAKELLKTASMDVLKNIFIDYAEFSSDKSEELAKWIVQERKHIWLESTWDLKKYLKSKGLWEKACAVIFQAIRIAVNWELDNLKKFLDLLPRVLGPGWRALVMSYHSLEDRMVKVAFKSYVKEWSALLVEKKAIAPNWKEVERNKAARSAKLRVLEWKL
jgi:16S rRNA (cytosine1402-N4)-methyltransferase